MPTESIMQSVIELQLALIGHLYDRGQIDPQAIVALLQKRLDLFAAEPSKKELRELLVAQINWLDRIGTGLMHGEKRPPGGGAGTAS